MRLTDRTGASRHLPAPSHATTRIARLSLPAAIVVSLWTFGFAVYESPTTEAAAPDETITFSKEIVRILQNNCQECHHTGGIAPFPLTTYAETAPYAESMKEHTQDGHMPPWQPHRGCGEFVGERFLSAEDKAAIAAWADAGAPEGNPADLPPPLSFDDEHWRLGEPDVVLVQAPHGFKVPANLNDDIFQNFSVKTNFTVDRYLSAIEIRPGDVATVHHVLLFLDVDGQSAALDRAYPGPGYENENGAGFDAPVLLSWNPGAPGVRFPDGVGMLIPRGSRLVVQVHYSSTNEVRKDKTYVGLHFARTPIEKARFVIQPRNEQFTIPAGIADYVVTAEQTLAEDVTVNTITPHMHRLGFNIDVKAYLPDGSTVCMIDSKWDVHQQATYVYKHPVALPAGTLVRVTGHYDNTADNPYNPNNPPRDVPWGRESFNEMLFAFLGVTRDAEQLSGSAPAITRIEIRGTRLVIWATDLREGALIEVAGRCLADSKASVSKGTVTSSSEWKATIKRGVPVEVRILNPDGGRTAGVIFNRL
jgi:hypothetical protein